MTTWKKDVDWISESDFAENPVSGNITAVASTQGKYGAECTLTLRLQQGTANERTKQLSVFKHNLNWLIEHFGEDDSAWLGRTITIKMTKDKAGKMLKELM